MMGTRSNLRIFYSCHSPISCREQRQRPDETSDVVVDSRPRLASDMKKEYQIPTPGVYRIILGRSRAVFDVRLNGIEGIKCLCYYTSIR